MTRVGWLQIAYMTELGWEMDDTNTRLRSNFNFYESYSSSSRCIGFKIVAAFNAFEARQAYDVFVHCCHRSEGIDQNSTCEEYRTGRIHPTTS